MTCMSEDRGGWSPTGSVSLMGAPRASQGLQGGLHRAVSPPLGKTGGEACGADSLLHAGRSQAPTAGPGPGKGQKAQCQEDKRNRGVSKRKIQKH